MTFRIGIHVGDVMVRGGDLLGDGVNIAARLQAAGDKLGKESRKQDAKDRAKNFRWGSPRLLPRTVPPCRTIKKNNSGGTTTTPLKSAAGAFGSSCSKPVRNPGSPNLIQMNRPPLALFPLIHARRQQSDPFH
jgi:hypothetical protein